MKNKLTLPYTAVIGLGKTGLSYARYLSQKKRPFILMDSRENPPNLLNFQQEFPDINIYLGGFNQRINARLIKNSRELLLSPGISLEYFSAAQTVLSDIELFAREAKAPIIGITGTNAKTTVTRLIGKMIEHAGCKFLIGGNIGIPALELLTKPVPDFYVLELSSFQLETVSHLALKAGVILNLSPDHLDRHKTIDNYYQIKQKIYRNCENIIFNREDCYTAPVLSSYSSKTASVFSFGGSPPVNVHEFGIVKHHLVFQEHSLPVKDLKIQGRHNQLNALAALALGQAVNLPWTKMHEALKNFSGLEHRCEWVSSRGKIHWYNDSKGTNIGATLASLVSLGISLKNAQKIILIAGGIGKNQDFSLLKKSVQQYVRKIILIGQDADLIKKALHNDNGLEHQALEIIFASSLKKAVLFAKAAAQKNDVVLFSPACASFDMFRDFEDRGDQFKTQVKDLSA